MLNAILDQSVKRAIRLLICAALLICGALLMLQALGAGAGPSDDYGIITIGGQISQHEDCEEGQIWVPSTTNPIAGECVDA